MMRRLVMGLWLLLAVPAVVHAQGEIIDRIVAVVDDEAIFESEVDQAAASISSRRARPRFHPPSGTRRSRPRSKA